MANVVVRMQTMDGTWEIGGADRRAGITPEHVKYGADLNGASTASFDLRRDPGAFWPDIAAFTPVDIEIDGLLVWSGRVKETPTRETTQESVINVQCEGWQFHLDDDVYQKEYVRTSMGDWKDTRSFAATNLVTMPSSGVSTLDSNGIGQWLIGFPNGSTWPSGVGSGITLDLGPAGDIAKRIVITANRTAGVPATVSLYARTTSVMDNPIGGTGMGSDAISAFPLTSFGTSPSTLSGTFSAGARYVHLFLYNSPTAYAVNASDGNGDVLIITSIQVFTSTAYESGNTSILPASTVVADTLGVAPLLTQDTTQVTTTSFAIPDFGVRAPQTPREVQDAVNAFHNYSRKVDVNKRLVFKPKASVAVLVAGDSSNIEIEDASANSGDEIYNRVYVTATGPDGTPLIVTVTASQISSLIRAISSPAPTNPSGDVNATGWSVLNPSSAATRSTTVFDSSPGSILTPVSGPGGQTLVGTFTGTFRRSTTYLLTFMAWKNNGGGIAMQFGDIAGGDYTYVGPGGLTGWPASTWSPFSISWTPRADTSAVSVYITQAGGGGSRSTQIGADTLVLSQGVPTIPDRRGFLRTKHLPLDFPATLATMTQIGSIYLADHLRTPFKGSVTAHGNGAITGLTSGDPTPIWSLPAFTGEMLRLNNRIDPDTGGVGRDGRIAQVDVDVDTASATIALDSTRQNFESFLSRLALVTGTRLGGS